MRSRYSAFVLGDIDYIQNTSGGEARLKFDPDGLICEVNIPLISMQERS